MDVPAPDTRNIVLTGFMGTGKTTVGRLLADELGFDFVDTDEIIEGRHGPIRAIFDELGEAAFRAIERDVATELSQGSRLVISTGGRLMLDPENIASLSRNGRVFCLVATPEAILERVAADEFRVDRPLLAVDDPRQRIVELLAERNPEYCRFAQLTTDGQSPESIAKDIATLARSDPERFAIETPTGQYDVSVGAAILPFVRQLAGIEGPLVVVTNAEVAELYLPSCPTPDEVVILPSGSERRKSLEQVSSVLDALLDAGMDRSVTIMALGDSIVGEIAAFAAAMFLRGVDLVHCPTDLIAMIDTSVGGKVGLDTRHGRDLLGLYKQPKAVIADVATLQTLDARQFAAGMAEVLKHALIADAELLAQLEAGNWSASDRDLPRSLIGMQSLVTRAIQVKIAILQEDPFDLDRRAVLNLGHTFAHAFEQVGDVELIHGEAVGIGLVAASRLSAAVGHCSADLAVRIERLVAALGLPTMLPRPVGVDAIREAISRDEKRWRSRHRFVLLRDIGDPFVTDDVPESAVREILASIQP